MYPVKMKHIPFLFLFFIPLFLTAQTPAVEILTTGTNSNLRGLSVVNDNVIWVSGSNGTVGKSSNAGKNWKWMTVKGFEKKDFRDIEAFDANTAIIMAIEEPAYILKTTDGGDTWKVVYENKTKGMFLDAMDFATPKYGMVVGDPINGNAFLAETTDGGETWKEWKNEDKRLAVDSGEAFFAASGSNIRLFNNKDFFLSSGGTKSRLITKKQTTPLPLIQGKETTGANAIDIFDDGIPNKPGKKMIVVGGDFLDPTSTTKNCFMSSNSGKTWKAPVTPPHGYRSSVEFLSRNDLLSCGLNGVDYSRDNGKNWKWISKESFNVCRMARIGGAVYLAGAKGSIGKLISQ